MSPFKACLFLQGLETLSLRGKHHNSNAFAFAESPDKHPNVAWVNCPDLLSHGDYALTKKVLNGFGAVLTLEIPGNIHGTAAMVDDVKLCSPLANVVDAKTIMLHIRRSAHYQIPD